MALKELYKLIAYMLFSSTVLVDCEFTFIDLPFAGKYEKY